MMLMVLGVEYLLGWFHIIGLKPGFDGATIATVLAARFIHFASAAICEETAYRSYLLQNFGERFQLWLAVLITGAVFAASHYGMNGFGVGFVVSGIIASYFLAGLRLVSRTIWLGIGWHWGWDWIEDSTGLIPGYSPFQTERLAHIHVHCSFNLSLTKPSCLRKLKGIAGCSEREKLNSPITVRLPQVILHRMTWGLASNIKNPRES
jgi:membrane protease YdiL (CAAX protease family)